MSNHDQVDMGCDGCRGLLTKVAELKEKLVDQLREQGIINDLHDKEKAAISIERDELDRKYKRAYMLQKQAEKQCARAQKTRERFRHFIEDVAKAAPENTPLREQAQATLKRSDD